MRKLLAIGLTLLLTVAALAQDPSVDSALARVATTGHVNGPDQQMLRSLPWHRGGQLYGSVVLECQ